MRASRSISVLTALFLGVAAGPARATVYVDGSALPGVGDGTSWGAALARVQEGVDAAARAGGDEVWVREGTYFENVGIPDGVAVYGGFAGGEVSRAERDPAKHVTVLDGGKVGTTVRIGGGPTTRVDGFTIQNGLTGRDRPGGMLGGGLYVGGSAVVANNVIARNTVDLGWGGGMYVDGSALVTGNLIYDNRASSGGGIFAVEGNPRILGNTILNNSPGGMFVWATSAVIANNVILDVRGTAIFLASGRDARLVHNVIGRCAGGVAIDLDFSSFIANNYFFSNQIAVSSSNTVVSDPNAVVNNAFFQNGALTTPTITLGAGNLFQSCAPNSASLTGGFHLTPGSPCVDAGLASVLPADLLTDRDGEPRVAGAAPDIGADELSFPVTYLAASGTAGLLHWFTTPVTVALSADAGAAGLALTGTSYSDDGGATWLPYTAPVVLADEGRVTRLAYGSTATDGATAVAELAKEVVIGVDTRAPVVELAIPEPDPSGWYTTAPTVAANVFDPAPGSGLASATWGCGTAAGTPYTAPFAFACDGGPATLTFDARDVAGNLRRVTRQLMVDAVPPSTGWWFEFYATWYTSDLVTHVAASNPGSGVARVEYSLDGVTWLPYAGAVVISTDGRHTLSARAWDPLGRVGPVSQAQVLFDRTPPVTTVTLAGAGPGPGGAYASDVTVTLSAADALSGVASTSFALDGAASQPYSGPFTVSAEGAHALAVSSIDVAGNPEPPRAAPFTIDRTPPAVSSTSPANGAVRVPRTATIAVTYGEPVWPGPALAGVAVTYVRGGRTIPVPVTRAVSGSRLVLTPIGPLPSAPIQVALPAGAVQDGAGLGSAAGGFGFTAR